MVGRAPQISPQPPVSLTFSGENSRSRQLRRLLISDTAWGWDR